MKANKNDMNDELLVKYLLGEASTVERHAVEQWINADSKNKRYFNHFQLIWETSKQLVIPPTVNVDDAWQRFQQRTQVSKKPAPLISITIASKWMRVAAAVMLGIGVISLAYFLSDRFSTTPIIVTTASQSQS